MTEFSVVADVAGLGRRLAEIAVEAAAVIRPYWRAGVQATFKADESPVTAADHAGEALILERLQRDFPGVGVVAEEQCAACGAPGSLPPQFFLVDALDGTRGFTRGSEDFTVNIGLIVDGYPAAGAVCTPADGRVWFTENGGARLQLSNGAERTVRVRPRPGESEALLSRSAPAETMERLGRELGFTRWRGVESSLKFCLIAQGDADLYPRTGPTSEWDTAAGQAVLEAAGGTVESFDGSRLKYAKVESRLLNPPFVARGA